MQKVHFPNSSLNELIMEQTDVLFDICVVGAGLVGSAAARHCSAISNLKILIIGPDEPKEKEENRDIFGCHYDESRITRIYDPLAESQILNRNSISRYREIEIESGISFYKPLGCLFYGGKGSRMVNSAMDGNPLLLNVTQDLSLSHPQLRLQNDELAYLEPSPAGMINPRKLVAAQLKIAQSRGCHVVRDVVEIITEVTDDNVKTTALKLSTSNGKTFRSKKVLLCTNAFTNFKTLLPSGKKAKISYKKSQIALLQISLEEANRLRTIPSIIYERLTTNGKPGAYSFYAMPPVIYPDEKWYLKVGYVSASMDNLYTLQEMKEWYTNPTRSEDFTSKRERLHEIAKEIIPNLKVEGIRDMTCSTAESPTHLPYVDMVTPNLGVAICGNGNSAKSSDELGRIAANVIAKDQWVSEIPREKFQIIWEE